MASNDEIPYLRAMVPEWKAKMRGSGKPTMDIPPILLLDQDVIGNAQELETEYAASPPPGPHVYGAEYLGKMKTALEAPKMQTALEKLRETRAEIREHMQAGRS